MKKLYRVTFEVEAIVAAEDWDEAYDVAQDFSYDILTEESSPIPLISEIDLKNPSFSNGWDENCIPYGAVGDMRISEFLTTGDSGK